MVMKRGAAGGAGSGFGKLLTPTDGSYAGGAIPITEDTNIHDSVDKMNEFLALKFPEPATLGSINSVSDARLWSENYVGGAGGIEVGLISEPGGYSIGSFAAAQTQNITQTPTSTHTSFGQVNQLNNGSTLELFIDYGTGFVTLGSLTISGTGEQTGGNSAAAIKVSGTSAFTGSALNAQASGGYSGFVRIDLDFDDVLIDSTFRSSGGYFNLRLDHTVGTNTFSNSFSDFTANGVTSGAALYERVSSATPTPPSIDSFDIALSALGTPRNLSGVGYATTGATFNVTGSASNLFLTSYGENPPTEERVYTLGLASFGTADRDFDGPDVSATVPPQYNDAANLADLVTVGSTSVGILDARPTAKVYDPHVSVAPTTAPSNNIRVATHIDPVFQSLAYDFNSEKYRGTSGLDAYNYNGGNPLVFSSAPLAWNPAGDLNAYDDNLGLQQIAGTGLVYPILDFSGGTPVGSPNYSGSTGTRIFRGFFEEGVLQPRFNGTISWGGNLTYADIGTKFDMYLRIPNTPDPWLDIKIPFGPTGAFVSSTAPTLIQFSLAGSPSGTTGFLGGGQTVHYLLIKIEYHNPAGIGNTMSSITLT